MHGEVPLASMSDELRGTVSIALALAGLSGRGGGQDMIAEMLSR